MGFEITQGAVFYIVMMLIVVLLGIALVTGFKVPSANKLKALSATFEPGKIYITNDKDIGQFTRIDCSDAVYKITLDGVKFATKKGPSDKSDVFKFITILDYDGLLFIGQKPGGNDDTEVVCTANDELFECPDNLKLEFRMAGVIVPRATQTFHFTTWEANPAIKNVLTPDMTLNKLLDDYGSYYISSFDVLKNVDTECKRTFCTQIESSITCVENNENMCYWDSGWLTYTGCRYCPDYNVTDCKIYNKAQCTQCPVPKANCQTGGLIGYDCIPA